MAVIRHLENRHDVIIFYRGWSDLDKMSKTGSEWHTAVIWSKSKPGVEFRYGGRLGEFNGMSSQSHVSHCRVLPPGEFTVTIPELHATLQGVVTWRNQYHDRAIAGCKNSIRHIENRFSPYFICLFLMQFRLWRAGAFVSSFNLWLWSAIHLFVM